MTVHEYNTIYYPAHNKAVSFVNCLNHALEKCDDNARMQLNVIGWDEQTKKSFTSCTLYDGSEN